VYFSLLTTELDRLVDTWSSSSIANDAWNRGSYRTGRTKVTGLFGSLETRLDQAVILCVFASMLFAFLHEPLLKASLGPESSISTGAGVLRSMDAKLSYVKEIPLTLP
jgi:hypothetical protein